MRAFKKTLAWAAVALLVSLFAAALVGDLGIRQALTVILFCSGTFALVWWVFDILVGDR